MSKTNRYAGILLHPTSLPSPYGIGDLGKSAYTFIDFLEQAGQGLWQTLPLTHTGYGDSPYQGFSAFAGQPLLIDPEHLAELDLLTKEDLTDCPEGNPSSVDYGPVIAWKTSIFKRAYQRFYENYSKLPQSLVKDYETFCIDKADWLDDYALFMTCKDLNGGKSWLEWPEDLRLASATDRVELCEKYKKEVGYYRFIQFLFFTEWAKLKTYANNKNIKIIGDIPIFVSMDSADVWANQGLFQLDTKGYPTVVAGVPPDYFSKTGQLWGNPLYNWKEHVSTDFAWWIARIKSQLDVVDILRIDHFRGFESYWAIPAGEKTAIAGEWRKSPGRELFNTVKATFGDELPIIAEDLGIITDEVTALREEFAFPGMKILQFAFDSTEDGDYLPHNYTSPKCVCYTGTHDNDTSNGWYSTLAADCKKKVKAYTGTTSDTDITRGLMRACFGSVAEYAIVPMQDVLRIGTEGRMNTPSVAAGNWSWRMTKDVLTKELAKELKDLAELFGRLSV